MRLLSGNNQVFYSQLDLTMLWRCCERRAVVRRSSGRGLGRPVWGFDWLAVTAPGPGWPPVALGLFHLPDPNTNSYGYCTRPFHVQACSVIHHLTKQFSWVGVGA
jgi:hypothetical protein